MAELILSQVKAWGFRYQFDEAGACQILPSNKTERWKLLWVDDCWLLVVGNIPQIRLRSEEARKFLLNRFKLESHKDQVRR